MAWYGIKTAFRLRVFPDPRTAPRKRARTLVEERLVLVRADTGDAALAEAEAEARRYVAAFGQPKNAFGERIRMTWLGELDAFELFQKPGNGVEVFSSSRLVSASKADSFVSEVIFGAGRPRDEQAERMRFIGGDIGRQLVAATGVGARRKPSRRGASRAT